MNVKVQKQENSKVVLEFTMPKDDFNKELDVSFKKNSKYFKVPGFRNGKVPRNVVEKVYGVEALYETVIENNVDKEYQKAIEENKLDVVSKPEMDIKEIGKDKDFVYTVTFYVKPEVKVKNYKGLEIEKVDTKVTKKDVDAELKSVQEKNAETYSIDDRELRDGDISTIDFEGFVDGVAFEGGKGENYELTIGSHQFIDNFEEQLIGMNIGDEREIKVTFPKDYQAEHLASKEATFKVKLISIKEKKLPKLDDEFAKDVSEFETLKEYTDDLKKQLTERKEHAAHHEREDKAMNKLLENVEVEIPEAMIDTEVDRMVNEFAQNLSYQGMTLEQFTKYSNSTVEEFKNNLRPDAIKSVKLNLAMEYIEKAENIVAEDSEIDAKIDELYGNYSEMSDTTSIKNNPNAREYMSKAIKQEKTLKLIVDSAVEK